MRVIHKESDDPTVTGGWPSGGPLTRTVRQRFHRVRAYLAMRGFQTQNTSLHSIAWPNTGMGLELANNHADVVHLHWLGNSTISIEEIGRIRQPVIWRLADMWAFCGAEHYVNPPPYIDERFVSGYFPANRPSYEQGPDINLAAWRRKRNAWHRPMHIVCPSRWMADCVRRSELMGNWPVSVIPTAVDPRVWAPLDRATARQEWNLRPDTGVVLFGAMGGDLDPRKGGDLLFDALRSLYGRLGPDASRRVELVIFGRDAPNGRVSLPFRVHYTGHIADDARLRSLYSAADVMVIASRQDNLPGTGLEAQACGLPVVAFHVGGLADVLVDSETGRLAPPFDTAALAACVQWVLEHEEPGRLRAAASARASRLWSPETIAKRYADLYAEVCAASR